MDSNNQNKLLSIEEFLKETHFLKLTNDAAFKTYFKSNKQLLISLLTSFLPLPKGSIIIEVESLDSELSPMKVSVDEKKSDKTFVLDLLVRFERKTASSIKQTETVNVEMQTTSEPYFTNRALAYLCRIYFEQLKKGSGYKKLFPVYLLAFTTKNLKEFKGIKDYYHVCNIRRTESPEILMSGGLCFVIVELNKFAKNVKELYNTRESWCYLLKNSCNMGALEYRSFKEKGGQMAKAVKSLWNLSQEEIKREYLFALEKRERDRISREEFVRKEANEKGIKKGIKKGIEQGREKGRQEGIKEVVLKLLHADMSVEKISQITGFSKEEILKLQEEL